MEGDSSLEGKLSTLISAIKQSQTSEKEVIDMLQSDTNINEFDIEKYLSNIDAYTEDRQENMRKVYELTLSLEEKTKNNLDEAKTSVNEFDKQIKLLSINEQRLTEIKDKIDAFKELKSNKSRSILMSDYYRKYYRAWSGYMGLLFFVLLFNIIIGYLVFKGFIPNIVIPIILPISIVILILFSSDLRKRDHIIFDEYKWNFNSNNVKLDKPPEPEPAPIVSSNNKCAIVASSIKESGGTIQCEEGKIYDEALFKCVEKPEETESNKKEVEGFSMHSAFKTYQIE